MLIKNFVTIGMLSLTAFTFTPVTAYAVAANVKPAKVVHKCSKRNSEDKLLACAIYAESRGEGHRGMRAVGNVVINRVSHKDWPSTVKGVVFQRGQFTYQHTYKVYDKESWDKALVISRQLIYLNNNFPEVRSANDPTKGALFFKKKGIRTAWQKHMKLVFQYKGHQFYL